MIQVAINGETKQVQDGLSVRDLLQALAITREQVAVEINHHLVRRAEFDRTRVRDGDAVEIVTFVGGG